MATMLRTLLSLSPWVAPVRAGRETRFSAESVHETSSGKGQLQPGNQIRRGTPGASPGTSDAWRQGRNSLRSKAVPSVARTEQEASELAKGVARIERRHAELQRTLSDAGRRLLLEQFCNELERILDDQAHVEALFTSAQEWARRTLTRQYFAIRSAAEILNLPNLAAIAGRAEVLLGLLNLGKIVASPLHVEVLIEVRNLLRQSVCSIREQGNDHGTLTAVQTATCLLAAVEPQALEYMPAPNVSVSGAPKNA